MKDITAKEHECNNKDLLYCPNCDDYYTLAQTDGKLVCPVCNTKLWDFPNIPYEKGNIECRRCGAKGVIIPSKSRKLCIGCDYLYSRWYSRKKAKGELQYNSKNSRHNIDQFVKELPPVKFRFGEKTIINTNEYEVV